MGVTGASTTLLGPPNNKKMVSFNLKQNIILFDGLYITHRAVIGSLNSGFFVTDRHGNKDMETYYLVTTALRFSSKGFIPWFVFDGSVPQEKEATVKKRQDAKRKANDAINDMTLVLSVDNEHISSVDQEQKTEHVEQAEHVEDVDQAHDERDMGTEIFDEKESSEESNDSSDEEEKKKRLERHLKYLKRSLRINKDKFERAKLIIRYMGFPVIDAQGEADPQLAALAAAHSERVVGIVTGDFDPLMYMEDLSILKLKNFGTNVFSEHSIDDTLKHLSKEMNRIVKKSKDPLIRKKYKNKDVKLIHDNLIDIGCLMGTDYCPRLKIKLDGAKYFDTILEIYARNDMNLKKVLKYLRNTHRNVDDSYIEKMMKARDMYKKVNVMHPADLDLSLKKPNEIMLRTMCADLFDEEELNKIIENLLTLYHIHKKFENNDQQKSEYHDQRKSEDHEQLGPEDNSAPLLTSCREKHRTRDRDMAHSPEMVGLGVLGDLGVKTFKIPEPKYKMPIVPPPEFVAVIKDRE